MKKLIIYFISLWLPVLACSETLISEDGYTFDVNNDEACIIGVSGITVRKALATGHLRIPDEFIVDGAVYKVTEIADGTFYSNIHKDFEELTLPQGLKVCGAKNFRISGIKKINFGNSLEIIHCQCFSHMFSLKNIELPLSLTALESDCFRLSGIESLSLPPNCTIVGGGNPDEGGAFSDMPALTNLELNNVVTILNYSFYNLPELKHVVIPGSCIHIGYGSFTDLASLSYVRFGQRKGATIELSDDTFGKCPALQDIYLEDGIPFPIIVNEAPVSDSTFYEKVSFDPSDITLHVPSGAKDAYATDPYWGRFGTIVDDVAGVDEIGADSSDVPAEYFTLQGVRVENPASGIYIRRSGSAVSKVVIP